MKVYTVKLPDSTEPAAVRYGDKDWVLAMDSPAAEDILRWIAVKVIGKHFLFAILEPDGTVKYVEMQKQ